MNFVFRMYNETSTLYTFIEFSFSNYLAFVVKEMAAFTKDAMFQ